MRKIVVLAAVAALAMSIVPASASSAARVRAPAVRFGAPVKVTPELGAGYEPFVTVDQYGNIYATAHKENWQLTVAPDPNAPLRTRSVSWAWVSTDDGKSFRNMPGLTDLALDQHDFGDEGDMALDDAGHLYFQDTNVGDVTFTRWKVTGRGEIEFETHRPVNPAGEPVDDRPWVTAHLDGSVFYLGNEGDKESYTGGLGRKGSGNGPGRYTVYASYDAGETFDTAGYTLKDSGWCRPQAESGTKYVYVICTNDEGTLYSYVSKDDGHVFQIHEIGKYHGKDPYQSWPTVVIAPDHSLWVLYIDVTRLSKKPSNMGKPIGNRILLYHSTDHGRTWSRQNITPMKGRYEYQWLAISPNGKKLGMGVYYRRNWLHRWRVYGAVWKPGQVPTLTSLDQRHPVQAAHCNEAPGDLLGSAFGPDGELSVVWTRNTMPDTCGLITYRDIYYARTIG